jgi:hypothetical protein
MTSARCQSSGQAAAQEMALGLRRKDDGRHAVFAPSNRAGGPHVRLGAPFPLPFALARRFAQ